MKKALFVQLATQCCKHGNDLSGDHVTITDNGGHGWVFNLLNHFTCRGHSLLEGCILFPQLFQFHLLITINGTLDCLDFFLSGFNHD